MGLDSTVLATDSCGPTSVLVVHEINKKFGSLCLKIRFSSWFSVFTVRPPSPVQSRSENLGQNKNHDN